MCVCTAWRLACYNAHLPPRAVVVVVVVVAYVCVLPAEQRGQTYEKSLKDMPWKGIVHSNATVANLIRKAEIRVLPAVIVVDDKVNVVGRGGGGGFSAI